MMTACIAAILVMLAPAQDDKRIAELERRIAELEKRVKELEGLLAKREGAAPGAPAAPADGEAIAINGLKQIATAQADFRANDRDGNVINDFWTGDVNALYALCPSLDGKSEQAEPTREKANRLIEPAVAEADAAPRAIAGVFAHLHTPKPKSGYLFRALDKYEEDGALHDYRTNTGGAGSPYAGNHHRTKFGFVAYPAEHGKRGTLTFIMNEQATIWSKDTGGKPPAAFPKSPAEDGWRKVSR